LYSYLSLSEDKISTYFVFNIKAVEEQFKESHEKNVNLILLQLKFVNTNIREITVPLSLPLLTFLLEKSLKGFEKLIVLLVLTELWNI